MLCHCVIDSGGCFAAVVVGSCGCLAAVVASRCFNASLLGSLSLATFGDVFSSWQVQVFVVLGSRVEHVPPLFVLAALPLSWWCCVSTSIASVY